MEQDLAILQLLSDDDPETVHLVRAKLEEVKSVAQLRALQQQARGVAARHVGELIVQGLQREADARFETVCATLAEDGELEEASWLMAATFAPARDDHAARRTMETWAAELRGRLTGVLSASGRVEVLVQFLAGEQRLRGNDGNYYALENSLLPRVLETRLGIPISLSLVYMLVGRRAGLEIEGVGLPGHFIARHEDVFFDPFHGGRRMSLEECAALLEQQNLALTPQHLRPATSRQILLRMLTNLYYIAEQSDPALAAKISRWAEKLK